MNGYVAQRELSFVFALSLSCNSLAFVHFVQFVPFVPIRIRIRIRWRSEPTRDAPLRVRFRRRHSCARAQRVARRASVIALDTRRMRSEVKFIAHMSAAHCGLDRAAQEGGT